MYMCHQKTCTQQHYLQLPGPGRAQEQNTGWMLCGLSTGRKATWQQGEWSPVILHMDGPHMDTVCSDRCQPRPVESCGRWVGPGPGAVEEMTEGSTGALGAALCSASSSGRWFYDFERNYPTVYLWCVPFSVSIYFNKKLKYKRQHPWAHEAYDLVEKTDIKQVNTRMPPLCHCHPEWRMLCSFLHLEALLPSRLLCCLFCVFSNSVISVLKSSDHKCMKYCVQMFQDLGQRT